MTVGVGRGGLLYEDRYERGNPTIELVDGLLPVVGKTKWTGTRINFLPDPEIFEKTRFREEDIKSRMHETTYLNPELTIEFTDKRKEPAEELVFHEPDGIVGFIRALNKSKETLTDVIYFKGMSDQITVEGAFQFVNEFHENVLGFCNNIYNAEGGTHLTGFKTIFTQVINNYARQLGTLKEKDANFTGADIRNGMTAVISIKHPDPRFEGQTKTKLDNQDATKAVSQVAGDEIVHYFDRNLEVLKTVIGCAEKAAKIRDKIRDVEGMMERQIALRTDSSEQDLIAVAQDGLDAMIQILYVRGGRMIGGDHFSLPREGGEDPGEVLAGFMLQYYENAGLIPRNVLCQVLPEGMAEQLEGWLRRKKGAAVTVAEPRRGEKHELIALAAKNAADALEKRNARRTVHEERTVGAAGKLGEILGMDRYPRRIEGYDISNTQGEQSVAAMVVFIDGEPAKKEYRHFRIRTVEGANDFASLYETLSRRYSHAAKEAAEGGNKFAELPDLILIDGGPQQLRFARQAILDLGMEPPTMFGLAEKQEEIWLPEATEPILLDHRTPELQLVQRVRDEAHRFGIIHHRALRGKASIHSRLEEIPGIGPARRKELLKAFGSLKAIREAEPEALLRVKGMNTPAVEAILRWRETNK
jgi:excinuclease ABC C subunit